VAISTDSDAVERFTCAIADFRAWAETVPADQQYGEWECDYQHWHEIHEAFRSLVATRDVKQWPEELVATALYAIARDNEMWILAGDLPRGALGFVTERALVESEPDARWQLAVELGRTPQPDGEQLLLRLVADHDEYVRRRALQSLAKIGAHAVTELALREWTNAPDDMPWTRMNALWALHHVGSPAYAAKLAEARTSSNDYLAAYAEKLASGAIDP
jgi:hypothetical protein